MADGLLLLDNEVLDDKNMKGETLGVRRLQSPFKKLVPLNKSVNTHIGIIKQNTPYFIDSKGMPFIYEKTLMCPLKYYKIKEVERKVVASVLKLYGVKQGFVVPRPPEPNNTWAGVLHFGGLPWLLYEYSEDKKKDTRRKV